MADVERGKGYGKRILLETAARACAELEVDRLLAVAKASNLAAAGAFKAAGFDLVDQITEKGSLCNLFVYTNPDGSE